MTSVKGKLRGFPSPSMRLSIDPRNNSDLLLQFDGSWERNWLPSSKSKIGRGSSLSSVTDGHRQKYFTALQVNCCTLGLKPTYGEWPSDTDLELDFSSPYTSCVFLSLFSSKPLQIFIFSLLPPFALAQPGSEASRQESFSVTLHSVLWSYSAGSSGPFWLESLFRLNS